MADARRAPLKDKTDISGARALIVEARFYDDIQDALLEGAVTELKADGIAVILSREDLPDMARFELNTTRELARFIAPKGSITLDGVSLTVNTVEDTAFSVLIIPHTLHVTTLSSWRAGSEVNIEVDLMARYAARLTEMK